jgi:DNA-binding PadR family transcriptional regulator
MVSRDQLAILKAIRSGPDGQGAVSTEREIEQQFPQHLHLLRQLDAEGYVEAVKVETEEPELSPPHTRIYRITEKGEAALQDAQT